MPHTTLPVTTSLDKTSLVESSPTKTPAKPTSSTKPTPIESRTKCNKCNKQFRSRNKLMKHVRTQTCRELPQPELPQPELPQPTDQSTNIKTLQAEIVTLQNNLKAFRKEFEEYKKPKTQYGSRQGYGGGYGGGYSLGPRPGESYANPGTGRSTTPWY